jgi:DNA-binding transcriptional ArsR family regulator
VLKEAGLVHDRQDGNRRLYAVDPRGLAELRSYLERYWDSALAAFKDAAERREDER